MRISNRTRFVLDAGLFLGVLVALFPGATGISVHEWLSLAIIVPTLFHLIINWDWVMRTCTRLLGRLRTISRVNLAVDGALFVATVTVMLSGFMVSQSIATALGVTIVPSLAWHVVHSLSAKISVLFMSIHLALHWRWVVCVVESVARGGVGASGPEPHSTLAFSASPRTEESCPPAYSRTP